MATPNARRDYRARLTDQSQPITEAPQQGRGSKHLGRPKTILIKRKKISLWLPESQLDELSEVLGDEQKKLKGAGRDRHEVTQTSLISQAIGEFLAKRRRHK